MKYIGRRAITFMLFVCDTEHAQVNEIEIQFMLK